MKCKNCGSEINEYERACPHCGEYSKTPQSRESHNSFISELRAKQSDTSVTSKKHIDTHSGEGWIKNIFNFDNIGQKIKTLAQWSCWVGIIVNWILCTLMFIVCLFQSELRHIWWIWPISAVIMPIILWIGSWYTYAIGNYIENDQKRTDSQAKIAQALNKSSDTNK